MDVILSKIGLITVCLLVFYLIKKLNEYFYNKKQNTYIDKDDEDDL